MYNNWNSQNWVRLQARVQSSLQNLVFCNIDKKIRKIRYQTILAISMSFFVEKNSADAFKEPRKHLWCIVFTKINNAQTWVIFEKNSNVSDVWHCRKWVADLYSLKTAVSSTIHSFSKKEVIICKKMAKSFHQAVISRSFSYNNASKTNIVSATCYASNISSIFNASSNTQF